jgi:O-acetyl-ADP-ribose deacetylase (regulator of RNase III)
MEKSALIKVKGNLLDMADAGDFDIIIQGCNCFNTMGAGLAPQIARRYPLAEAVDSDTRKGSISKLGNWTMAWSTNDNPNQKEFRIINAYTQYSTSRQGEDVFEYAAFELILRKLAHEYGGSYRYGLPYIGMGLAGGDKRRIMAMIENFAHEISAKGGTVTLVDTTMGLCYTINKSTR